MGLIGSTFKTFHANSDYTDAFVSTAKGSDVRNMLLYWFEQGKKHIHKCSSTNRPDIFFESYGFIIDNLKKCSIAATRTIAVNSESFTKRIQNFYEHREEETSIFLERYFNTVQARNSSYKSAEARQVVVSEFRAALAPHMEKLTPKLQQQVEEYCQSLLKAE